MATTGSVLLCDKGTVPVPLVAYGGASLKICGVSAAAITDIIPGSNVSPFRMCAITKAVCSPTPVGNWRNPIDNQCITGNTQSLLEGTTLPCTVGGTLSVMSASQASVLVGRNLLKLTPATIILSWVAHEESLQDPVFKGHMCNCFVVAAYAAAGIIIPKVKRSSPS